MALNGYKIHSWAENGTSHKREALRPVKILESSSGLTQVKAKNATLLLSQWRDNFMRGGTSSIWEHDIGLVRGSLHATTPQNCIGRLAARVGG